MLEVPEKSYIGSYVRLNPPTSILIFRNKTYILILLLRLKTIFKPLVTYFQPTKVLNCFTKWLIVQTYFVQYTENLNIMSKLFVNIENFLISYNVYMLTPTQTKFKCTLHVEAFLKINSSLKLYDVLRET